MHRALGVGVVVAVLAFGGVALAAASDLDTTFGGDGKVTTDFTSGEDGAFAVAIQADGKIVAAGSSGHVFGLARYNSDATLDPTFGAGGEVTTSLGPKGSVALGVAIQADGKIVAAGSAGSKFGLARYNTDGTLDATFGASGEVTTSLGQNGSFALGVAIQADGKIVAAGSAGSKLGLARYNADGSLDTTFSGDGKVITSLSKNGSLAAEIAIQADGKIVAAGSAGSKFGLARYTTNGTLDTTFSGDGKVTTSVGPNGSSALGVAIQADGKIVAAGSSGSRFGLARYTTNGTLDTTFSGDGKLATRFKDGSLANAVAIESDGRIVAAGESSLLILNGTFALARYDTDGTLDTTFSGDGKVTTNFDSRADFATAVAIQSDGRIVAAGEANYVSYNGKFALARYLGN
jgi:uncharacterized delta-60 repeat protein